MNTRAATELLHIQAWRGRAADIVERGRLDRRVTWLTLSVDLAERRRSLAQHFLQAEQVVSSAERLPGAE